MTQNRTVAQRMLVVQASEAQRGVQLDVLKEAGYRFRTISDEAAIPADVDPSTHVVVLDGLDEPGWQFLRALTAVQQDLAVLVSTAGIDSKAMIGLLDLGVQAHLRHDVSPRELVARVKWSVERVSTRKSKRTVPIDVDDTQRRVWLMGTPIDLPRREFEVLSVLVTHAGRVVSRDRLMSAVWGPSVKADSRSLDVRISRLRKHFTREAGADAPLIETVPGLGYRLVI